MKLFDVLEQLTWAASMCVVAVVVGMALAQCTPAHAEKLTIENTKSIETINKEQAHKHAGLTYPLFADTHCQFGLVANNSLAQIPRFKHAALFCVSFSTSVMVRLDGEAFAPASLLMSLSTNPVQSYHLHLVVNGKTSIKSLEVIHHV